MKNIRKATAVVSGHGALIDLHSQARRTSRSTSQVTAEPAERKSHPREVEETLTIVPAGRGGQPKGTRYRTSSSWPWPDVAGRASSAVSSAVFAPIVPIGTAPTKRPQRGTHQSFCIDGRSRCGRPASIWCSARCDDHEGQAEPHDDILQQRRGAREARIHMTSALARRRRRVLGVLELGVDAGQHRAGVAVDIPQGQLFAVSCGAVTPARVASASR